MNLPLYPFTMSHPNQACNNRRWFYPLRYCRHPAPVETPHEDEPFSGRQVGFDPLFKPVVNIVDEVERMTFDHGNHWPVDEVEDAVRGDAQVISILTDLESKNWDFTERRKLRSRINLCFESVLSEYGKREASWLVEARENDPERYAFIMERGLNHADDTGQLVHKYLVKARRVFATDLSLVAEWCMAQFCTRRWEWVKPTPFKFGSLLEAPVVPVEKPKAKVVAQDDPQTAHIKKLLAAARRQYGTDDDVQLILGNKDPR